jgi:hypothetical protein
MYGTLAGFIEQNPTGRGSKEGRTRLTPHTAIHSSMTLRSTQCIDLQSHRNRELGPGPAGRPAEPGCQIEFVVRAVEEAQISRLAADWGHVDKKFERT